MSVYFITAREVGRVKIGCGYDPWDRLERLKTGSPVELALEAVIDGSYDEERELHRQFAGHRIRGEWFNLCPEIEALIISLPAPVRGCEGGTRSQRKRILRLAADNAAIEVRADQRRKSDEELADEQIRRERELYAEAMRDFASLETRA
jgi:hypothetical protein